MNKSSFWTRLDRRLAVDGLRLAGALHAAPADRRTAGVSLPATLIVIGNAGPRMWARFSRAPEFTDRRAHPLARWVARRLTPLRRELGARLILPDTGPPFAPFLRWATRAEAVFPGPSGPLIHPRFGPWHAYRAVLAVPRRLMLPARLPATAPCRHCATRPCLSAKGRNACPIGRGYRYNAAQAQFHRAARARQADIVLRPASGPAPAAPEAAPFV